MKTCSDKHELLFDMVLRALRDLLFDKSAHRNGIITTLTKFLSQAIVKKAISSLANN